MVARGVRVARRAHIEHRDLTVEAYRGAGHQRFAMLHASAVDGVAGGEIVAAIQHHVRVRDELLQAVAFESLVDADDAACGIDLS